MIKNYSYSIDDYGNMIIYITDPNDNTYSVASISDCDEDKADDLALEILEELGYKFMEA